jgi:hypothetical protein
MAGDPKEIQYTPLGSSFKSSIVFPCKSTRFDPFNTIWPIEFVTIIGSSLKFPDNIKIPSVGLGYALIAF